MLKAHLNAELGALVVIASEQIMQSASRGLQSYVIGADLVARPSCGVWFRSLETLFGGIGLCHRQVGAEWSLHRFQQGLFSFFT